MSPAGSIDDLLLPPGTCLVHIGPPKTGTTAVQGAFHAARAETAAQGVHYAGRTRHSIGPRDPGGHRAPGGFFTDWRARPVDISALGARARQGLASKPAGKRVLVSSEFFADATEQYIPRRSSTISAASGVHVVVTLRPLGKIVTSQWQQYVQSGMRVSFPELARHDVQQGPRRRWTPVRSGGATVTTSWYARWVDAVGSENVTVVAVDDRDHGMLLRTFEAFTGLREGTLVAERAAVTTGRCRCPRGDRGRPGTQRPVRGEGGGLPLLRAQSRLVHLVRSTRRT